MKEDAIEFVEADKIKELVKRYSQFINYPIYLWVSKDVTKSRLMKKTTMMMITPMRKLAIKNWMKWMMSM